MAFAVRALASKYSKQYLNKLSKLLLDKSYSTSAAEPGSGYKSSLSEEGFELDLEVVLNSKNKVEDIIIR